MKPQLSSVVRNAHRLITHLNQVQKQIDKMLILTHDYPDPDALASAYALQTLLEKGYSIPSKIAYGGIIGRMENRLMVSTLKIPAKKLRHTDLKRYAHVALMDTQPHFRNNSFPKNKRAAMVIDQHPSTAPAAADFSIVDVESGATCVILAQALFSLKIDISTSLGTALIYGISTDTQNLHRAVAPIIFQTYARLLPYCDMKSLAKIQNPEHSKKFFITIRRAITKAMLARDLMVSHLGPVENPDLVAQASDFLLSYKKAKWTLCSGRFKNRLYVSFRIQDNTGDAGDILRDIFNNSSEAGGHGPIAGGSCEVNADATDEQWQEKEKNLAERLQKRLRISSKREFTPAFPEA